MSVGSIVSDTLASPAIAQDSRIKRCLSIVDINERVDCLETGTAETALGSQPERGQSKLVAPSPSFDCRAARTLTERAICSDTTLSDWDLRLAKAFQQALQASRDRQVLIDDQRTWLTQRDSSCTIDAMLAVSSCILEMTKSRARSLAGSTSLAEAPTLAAITTAKPASRTAPDSRLATALAEGPTPSLSTDAPRERFSSTSSDNSSLMLPILLLVLGLSLIALAVTASRHARRQREIESRLAAEQALRDAEFQRLVDAYGSEAASRILAHEV